MEAKFFELDAKMDGIRTKMASFPERVLKDYQGKLDVSWIYHDHALEGVVLSYSELKAAIDQRIISDVSLIPMYEEVKNHKLAVDFIREAVRSRKPPEVDLELVRKIYGILTPEAVAKGCPYRKENPLHRLYYHEIAPPQEIGYQMRQIAAWLAPKRAPPIRGWTGAGPALRPPIFHAPSVPAAGNVRSDIRRERLRPTGLLEPSSGREAGRTETVRLIAFTHAFFPPSVANRS